MAGPDGERRIYVFTYEEVRADGCAMSTDARYLAWWSASSRHPVVLKHDMSDPSWTDDWSLSGRGDVLRVAFDEHRVAVLYGAPATLEVGELSSQRSARLDLPEDFTDLVLSGHDLVAVHPELGAWWIPLASLAFEAVG